MARHVPIVPNYTTEHERLIQASAELVTMLKRSHDDLREVIDASHATVHSSRELLRVAPRRERRRRER